MEIPNCKDCEKLRVKLHHNCLKHCKCFEKFTWNPSDCSDCLLLFELAEVTSLPNEASVILCQLGKKMQNLARVDGDSPAPHGTIFASSNAYDSFNKVFLKHVVQLKKGKSEVLPSSKSPVTLILEEEGKSHDIPSLPLESFKSAGGLNSILVEPDIHHANDDCPSSSQNSLVTEPSPVFAQPSSSQILPLEVPPVVSKPLQPIYQNFQPSLCNDFTSFQSLNYPVSNQGNYASAALNQGNQVIWSGNSCYPYQNNMMPVTNLVNPYEVNCNYPTTNNFHSLDSLIAIKVSSAIAAMRPPASTILPPLVDHNRPVVIPMVKSSLSKPVLNNNLPGSSKSVTFMSNSSSQKRKLSSLDDEISYSGPSHLNKSKSAKTFSSDDMSLDANASYSDNDSVCSNDSNPGLHSLPSQNEDSCPSSDSEDESNHLVHWPTCKPITYVSEAMWSYLNDDNKPYLYVLNKGLADVSQEGLWYDSNFFKAEDVFVGLINNKLCLAIKSRSINHLILAKSLNKFETPAEEETISFSSLKRHLTCLSDWDQGKHSWKYEKKEGNVEFNVGDMKIMSLVNKNPTQKTKFPKLPWNWSSSSSEDQSILDFLQGPTLNDKDHKLPKITQSFTSPVSHSLKSDDDYARLKAKSGLSALFAVKQALILTNSMRANVSNVHAQDPNLALLEGVSSLLDLACKELEPVQSTLLEEASKTRVKARKEATKLIEDADIKATLVEADVWSKDLFPPAAINEISLAVNRPAPRNVKTRRSKSLISSSSSYKGRRSFNERSRSNSRSRSPNHSSSFSIRSGFRNRINSRKQDYNSDKESSHKEKFFRDKSKGDNSRKQPSNSGSLKDLSSSKSPFKSNRGRRGGKQ